MRAATHLLGVEHSRAARSHQLKSGSLSGKPLRRKFFHRQLLAFTSSSRRLVLCNRKDFYEY